MQSSPPPCAAVWSGGPSLATFSVEWATSWAQRIVFPSISPQHRSLRLGVEAAAGPSRGRGKPPEGHHLAGAGADSDRATKARVTTRFPWRLRALLQSTPDRSPSAPGTGSNPRAVSNAGAQSWSSSYTGTFTETPPQRRSHRAKSLPRPCTCPHVPARSPGAARSYAFAWPSSGPPRRPAGCSLRVSPAVFRVRYAIQADYSLQSPVVPPGANTRAPAQSRPATDGVGGVGLGLIPHDPATK